MAKKKVKFSVHPAVPMVAKWHHDLRKKTGKTVKQWATLAKKDGPPDPKDCRQWLKDEHGMGPRDSMMVTDIMAGREKFSGDPEVYLKAAPGYIEDQYAGKKAALRPIYDALLDLGVSLGKDVKVSPCQTMVPLYRNYVFAEIRPATNSRIDLALALGEEKPKGRLEAIKGSAANRVRHKIAIASPSDIDGDVKKWLKKAYEKGAEAQAKAAPTGEVPGILAAMLKKTAKARKTWETLTPKMQRDWIVFVTDAKKEETRLKRVERAMARLSAGKKSLY
ncbi:MAG: DUF5655 domain-containing protein [Planctomycetota bacterium]|jgi:hypothetical protein